MDDKSRKKWTYRDAGVDIAEGDRFISDISRFVRSTQDLRVLDGAGGFAGLFALKNQPGLFRREFRDPVLVGCTDGVGTKLKIAFETGVHRTVGIDLVAMSANDLVVCGAEPLFFLDYFATSKLDRKIMSWVVEGIAEGCKQAGMALLGGETAELPGFYKRREYDLAGFAVGVVERRRILSGETIEPGDDVIGIASSGVHSNGFSLVRAVLLDHARIALDEYVPELDDVLGEVLLKPTVIYANLVEKILRGYRVKKVIKGFAHITGGGLPGNLVRMLPENHRATLDPAAWTRPPIFDLIQKRGDVDPAEMYRVFNMGVGFCAVVSRFFSDSVLKKIERAGYPAWKIGTIEKGERGVEIKGIKI